VSVFRKMAFISPNDNLKFRQRLHARGLIPQGMDLRFITVHPLPKKKKV